MVSLRRRQGANFTENSSMSTSEQNATLHRHQQRYQQLRADGRFEDQKRLKWFKVYYIALGSAILAGVAVWFLFFRNPHPSHPSYDPFNFLPYETKHQLLYWYQHRGYRDASSGKRKLTGGGERPTPTTKTLNSTPRNDLPEMIRFLSKYEERGYFDSPHIKNFDHYQETMINGWLSGIFETIEIDSHVLDEIESEQRTVGSIPGGSRRLNVAISEAVRPLMNFFEDERRRGVGTNETIHRLAVAEHRNWVYEAISHCHTTPCRLTKLQLITNWRETLQLFPEHEEKENWKMLMQLFHPDTHMYKLIDAPPTASTLASLWFRFFATGDLQYLTRLLDLTRLTGAVAYAHEKDQQIFAWEAKKHARAIERSQSEWETAKANAKANGQPLPPQPTPILKPNLPESPTGELHQHFVNSLLYYGEDHPLVKEAFKKAWSLYPNDPVIQQLAQTSTFKLQP